MNICLPGACICDAREWPGDTNCMGEIDCDVCSREHKPGECP